MNDMKNVHYRKVLDMQYCILLPYPLTLPNLKYEFSFGLDTIFQ